MDLEHEAQIEALNGPIPESTWFNIFRLLISDLSHLDDSQLRDGGYDPCQ
jgi:hypothetical protein